MIVLPDAVRTRVVALAADVLGSMHGDEVPALLRPVARFAVAKRAKLGASAIAAALESEPAFRARVLVAAEQEVPGLADVLRQGNPPPAADPDDVALVAYLLRPDGWETLLAAAQESAYRAEAATRASRDAATAVRLREQLDATRSSARETRDRHKAEIDRLKVENATLRRRLNEARGKLTSAREAERAAAAALAAAQADVARSTGESETRRLRARLSTAEEALEATKRTGREGRELESARLGLLIDTLTAAAAGLRRELALPASDRRPADQVAAREPGDPAAGRRRGRGSDDPAFLTELLGLPKPHLVVDGYNVTKSVWGQLPLEAQRTRLVRGLGALAARTGAEVTCVFDGADVSVPPPVTPVGGVRVRFSPEGQIADELIGQLVRAEPTGRTVIVVSSDREVAASARRPGGYAVASAALVALLDS